MKAGIKKDWGDKVYQGNAGKMAKVTVHEKLCKGCEICVEFCPVKVLEMRGAVAVCVNADGCTKCMLCELRCPDFAIKVE